MTNFFRSCIEYEFQLCKGSPLCKNSEDLKWCKNGNDWILPDVEWVPFPAKYKCTKGNQPGQWIRQEEKGDGQIYHCLDRGDETPFGKGGKKNTTEDDMTWTEWMNTPCDKSYERRCLGQRPDQCVYAGSGEFFLVPDIKE